MSISGYAELMMNGMVGEDKVPEFSGRIYHEASRLSSLVSDIIQLSRLDEKNSDMPFEAVDIYELAEDIVYHLQPSAEKKQIGLVLEGSMWRCEESGRFSMKCFIILRTMPSAIPMQEEPSGCLQGRKDIIPAILWRIMGSVFRRMNRDVFLRGFTGWIKVIPVRPEAQAWGFLL